MTRPSPAARPAGAEPPAAQIAKLAFRRLALERLEPTPENYEKAFRQECGDTGNAGYWYAKARKPARGRSDIDSEWQNIAQEVLGS